MQRNKIIVSQVALFLLTCAGIPEFHQCSITLAVNILELALVLSCDSTYTTKIAYLVGRRNINSNPTLQIW